MCRPLAVLFGLFGLLALQTFPVPGLAVVIDNFESGPGSLTLSGNLNWDFDYLTPNPGHCIADIRVLEVERDTEGIGTLVAQLAPTQGVDDALNVTFPNDRMGWLRLTYWELGGPDLTEGGTHNQISIRAVGGSSQTVLSLRLDEEWHSTTLSQTGIYRFPFYAYSVDPTYVDEIEVEVTASNGEVIGIEDISTSNSLTEGLIYEVHTPSSYFSCENPQSGITAVDWDWALASPSQPPLAGPQLRLANVSASNCQGVTLNAFDSGENGQYGEMGMVTVDWEASTFDDATFVMRLTTDPGQEYTTAIASEPVVTNHGAAFTIRHSVNVDDVPGIPDGVVHQELIVAAGPGQDLTFDWVEAGSLGGAAAAYGFGFGVTASLYDPALSLFEIYTTSSYSDDAGTTGVPQVPAVRSGATLAAHPSITRTETRFVVSGETVGRAGIDIFDVTGRRVRQLEFRGGEALWNGTAADGSRVPAGVYFARTPGVAETARVVFLR